MVTVYISKRSSRPNQHNKSILACCMEWIASSPARRRLGDFESSRRRTRSSVTWILLFVGLWIYLTIVRRPSYLEQQHADLLALDPKRRPTLSRRAVHEVKDDDALNNRTPAVSSPFDLSVVTNGVVKASEIHDKRYNSSESNETTTTAEALSEAIAYLVDNVNWQWFEWLEEEDDGDDDETKYDDDGALDDDDTVGENKSRDDTDQADDDAVDDDDDHQANSDPSAASSTDTAASSNALHQKKLGELQKTRQRLEANLESLRASRQRKQQDRPLLEEEDNDDGNLDDLHATELELLKRLRDCEDEILRLTKGTTSSHRTTATSPNNDDDDKVESTLSPPPDGDQKRKDIERRIYEAVSTVPDCAGKEDFLRIFLSEANGDFGILRTMLRQADLSSSEILTTRSSSGAFRSHRFSLAAKAKGQRWLARQRRNRKEAEGEFPEQQHAVLQLLCEQLPTPQQVNRAIGPEPVILGLDTCQRYRDALHGAAIPRPRIAGLYHTGTNALAQALSLNLGRLPKTKGLDHAYNVPWGKHMPPEHFRLRNAHPANNTEGRIPRDHILPIVIVRDPFYWMKSMCKEWYDAKWEKPLDRRCPALLKEGITATPYPVYTQLDQGNFTMVNYTSLIHLWTDWNQQYLDADYPRLMIRFEDVLYRLPIILKAIVECSGVNNGTLPHDPIIHPALRRVKNHGHPEHFLHALGKYVATDSDDEDVASRNRRHAGLTKADRRFANGVLKDGSVATRMRYPYALLTTTDEELAGPWPGQELPKKRANTWWIPGYKHSKYQPDGDDPKPDHASQQHHATSADMTERQQQRKFVQDRINELQQQREALLSELQEQQHKSNPEDNNKESSKSSSTSTTWSSRIQELKAQHDALFSKFVGGSNNNATVTVKMDQKYLATQLRSARNFGFRGTSRIAKKRKAAAEAAAAAADAADAADEDGQEPTAR